MVIKVWSCDSDSCSNFIQIANILVTVEQYETLESLNESLNDGDIIFLDYDKEPKLCDKAIKELRKSDIEVFIILAANSLQPKKLAKHQNGKFNADLYIKTPITVSFLEAVLTTHFDYEPTKPLKLLNIVKPGDKLKANNPPEKATLSENTPTQPEVNPPLKLNDDNNSGVDLHLTGSDLFGGGDNSDELSPLSEKAEETSHTIQEKYNMAYPYEKEEESFDELGDDVIDDITENAGDEIAQAIDSPSANKFDDLEQGDLLDITSDEHLVDLSEGEEPFDFVSADEPFDISSGLDELTEKLDVKDILGEDSLDQDQNINNDDLNLSDNESENIMAKEAIMADDSNNDNELSLDGLDDLELGEDSLSEEVEDSSSLDDELDLSINESLDLELGSDDTILMETVDTGDDLDLGDADEFSSDDEIELGVESNELPVAPELDFSLSDEEDQDEMAQDLSLDGASVIGDSDSFDQLPDTDLEFTVNEDTQGAQAISKSTAIEAPPEDSEGSNSSASISTDFTVSETFQNKLSEIDELLASDEVNSTTVTRVTQSEVTIDQPAHSNDKTGVISSNELKDISDHHDEISLSDDDLLEEEEFDSSEFLSSGEVQEKIESTPRHAQNIPLNVIKEHREITQFKDSELERLGETINALRADRDDLLAKIGAYEQKETGESKELIDLRAQLDEKKIELALLRKRFDHSANELKYQLELLVDKKDLLEEKNRQLTLEVEKLNKKVRIDINKVRNREKELESKLELLRADSQVQIRNRDQKILELKRRIDTLEFDMEGMLAKEKKSVSQNYQKEEKIDKVINMLKTTLGELEEDSQMAKALREVKKTLDV